MRLASARIRGFRSFVDSGPIDFDESFSVLTGPNESGKSTLLLGLHMLNPSGGTFSYDALRDYPRRFYVDDVLRGGVDRDAFSVSEGHFVLSPAERGLLPASFRDVAYACGVRMDGSRWDGLRGAPPDPEWGELARDITALASLGIEEAEGEQEGRGLSEALEEILRDGGPCALADVRGAGKLLDRVNALMLRIRPTGPSAERFESLRERISIPLSRVSVLETCRALLPRFVLIGPGGACISPSISLDRLPVSEADDRGPLGTMSYPDLCLLRFLGFLSDGSAAGTGGGQAGGASGGAVRGAGAARDGGAGSDDGAAPDGWAESDDGAAPDGESGSGGRPARGGGAGADEGSAPASGGGKETGPEAVPASLPGKEAGASALDWRGYPPGVLRAILSDAATRLSRAMGGFLKPDTAPCWARRLGLVADGPDLKLLTADLDGVEIDLAQRPAAFQEVVSLFVAGLAEARRGGAVLLLDEPGQGIQTFRLKGLVEDIQALSKRCQTVMAIHGPALAAGGQSDSVLTLRRAGPSWGTVTARSAGSDPDKASLSSAAGTPAPSRTAVAPAASRTTGEPGPSYGAAGPEHGRDVFPGELPKDTGSRDGGQSSGDPGPGYAGGRTVILQGAGLVREWHRSAGPLPAVPIGAGVIPAGSVNMTFSSSGHGLVPAGSDANPQLVHHAVSPGPARGNGHAVAGAADDRESAVLSGSRIPSGGNGQAPARVGASGASSAQILMIRNLVVEGITDCWYLRTISYLVEMSGRPGIGMNNIFMIPAHAVGNIINLVKMLHGNGLRTVALFDSDGAGDQASVGGEMVNLLGRDRILRVRNFYSGAVKAVEIEDLLRVTLVSLAKSRLNIDITQEATKRKEDPITNIFNCKTKRPFKKTTLATAFARWAQNSSLTDLTKGEQAACISLVGAINRALG
ncbi:MAG: AAA family ATPase [Deltaproteobacteria bacterium]|jgi:hypothetical protein|nr:AAA family ATPase [Deltaproteobacteria bacterium]